MKIAPGGPIAKQFHRQPQSMPARPPRGGKGPHFPAAGSPAAGSNLALAGGLFGDDLDCLAGDEPIIVAEAVKNQ